MSEEMRMNLEELRENLNKLAEQGIPLKEFALATGLYGVDEPEIEFGFYFITSDDPKYEEKLIAFYETDEFKLMNERLIAFLNRDWVNLAKHKVDDSLEPEQEDIDW